MVYFSKFFSSLSLFYVPLSLSLPCSSSLPSSITSAHFLSFPPNLPLFLSFVPLVASFFFCYLSYKFHFPMPSLPSFFSHELKVCLCVCCFVFFALLTEKHVQVYKERKLISSLHLIYPEVLCLCYFFPEPVMLFRHNQTE